MSDLVERLREEDQWGDLGEHLCGEAANEITRLRAERDALRDILAGLAKRHEGWDKGCGPCICEWHEKARTKLEEKSDG